MVVSCRGPWFVVERGLAAPTLLRYVGEALTAYLCEARPPTQIRQVFLARKAPMRAIRADLVSDVTRRARERAGVPRVGSPKPWPGAQQ